MPNVINYIQLHFTAPLKEAHVIDSSNKAVNNNNIDNLVGTINNMSRGQKFHLSARNYEENLERTSNSSQSTRPKGALGKNNSRNHIRVNVKIRQILKEVKGKI